MVSDLPSDQEGEERGKENDVETCGRIYVSCSGAVVVPCEVDDRWDSRMLLLDSTCIARRNES